MVKIILLVIVFISLSSCTGYKFDIPEYENILSTSNAYNLPHNINFTDTTLPKNLKKVIQKKDDEIINILEYDRAGHLVFKYYRQYVGENWNGKYLTIIESNSYNENNKLIEQIILHSNLGITRDLYKYNKYGNLVHIESAIIEPKETNSNPWKYIENIHSNESFLKDKKSIIVKQMPFYESLFRKYDYKNRTVTESSKENWENKTYFLYKFNKHNNLISKENFYNGELNLMNSKYFNKDKAGFTEVEKNSKSILSTKRFLRSGDTLKINLNDIENSYIDERVYFGKILISQKAIVEGYKESLENYTLDKYHLPIEARITDYGEVQKTIKFENYYEFFSK